MVIAHVLSQTGDPVGTAHRFAFIIMRLCAYAGPVALVLRSEPITGSLSHLRDTASKIYRRMQSLGLNETELADRCSLAAVHMSEDPDSPTLTRDRISKILMNRQDSPAKSAARLITHKEVLVLAKVLKVSAEWLGGKGSDPDPVVWNVLGEPDRAWTFAHMLQEYEELGTESTVWSQGPMFPFTSDNFVHATHHLGFEKPGRGNSRAIIEFYNSLGRMRRKWLLREDRSFDYVNLIFQADFEQAICGHERFSAISRTIRTRNLDVMIEVIANSALRLKLVIVKDECPTLKEALENYQILSTIDTLFSTWRYRNGDLGWSEHPGYVEPHHDLLASLKKHSLCEDVSETVEYLKKLKDGLV